MLKRLGIEDCFESVICFETLNPTNNAEDSVGAEETEHIEQPNTGAMVPKTRVVCKPFELAYEEAFKFANIDPQRTVRSLLLTREIELTISLINWLGSLLSGIIWCKFCFVSHATLVLIL